MFDDGTKGHSQQIQEGQPGFARFHRPGGPFVGKTSVSFDVELTAADGHRIFAGDITSSKRMDTESLGVAKSAAKAITKRVNKLLAIKTPPDFQYRRS